MSTRPASQPAPRRGHPPGVRRPRCPCSPARHVASLTLEALVREAFGTDRGEAEGLASFEETQAQHQGSGCRHSKLPLPRGLKCYAKSSPILRVV